MKNTAAHYESLSLASLQPQGDMAKAQVYALLALASALDATGRDVVEVMKPPKPLKP